MVHPAPFDKMPRIAIGYEEMHSLVYHRRLRFLIIAIRELAQAKRPVTERRTLVINNVRVFRRSATTARHAGDSGWRDDPRHWPEFRYSARSCRRSA